jgi:6-phosphogluconolactonase
MKVKIEVYKTAVELATSFANQILILVRDAENQKKRLNLMLSGGSTPAILFRKLAEIVPDNMNFSQIHFYWGDERCVPPNHSESNYGTAKSLLLDKIQIPDSNIHPLYLGEEMSIELKRNEEMLSQITSFDLIMLGLGEDGHTASVFPDNMLMFNLPTNCTSAIHPVTGQQRITVTPKFLIEKAKTIVLMVTGANKAEILVEIFTQSQESVEKYPAALLLSKRNDIRWLLDEDAVSLLKLR